MKEVSIHYIWQYLLFDTHDLKTTRGESIQIIKQGSLNQNQGPDFLLSNIQIGNQNLYGSVEIHIQNTNWYQHKHQLDPNYDNVILHVVYHKTDEIYTLNSQNAQIPILCLEDNISLNKILKIEELTESKQDIPCSLSFVMPQNIVIEQFKTRLFSERIIRKSAWINELIKSNLNDTESSFYQAILSGFGIKVNADIFLDIAKSIPQKVLARHIDNLFQLEAILLGQANLLENTDEYSSKLLTEYTYLAKLHSLNPISNKPLKSKMLPASFPTIRLVQFASFIYQKQGLFSKLIQFERITDIQSYFDIEVSEYWQTHYDFGKTYLSKKKIQLSSDFIEKILINVILPFRFLIEVNSDKSTEHTIELYNQLKAEVNQKTKRMQSVFDLKNKSAFDSQAKIEWYTNYCTLKKCLECPIGYQTLRQNI